MNLFAGRHLGGASAAPAPTTEYIREHVRLDPALRYVRAPSAEAIAAEAYRVATVIAAPHGSLILARYVWLQSWRRLLQWYNRNDLRVYDLPSAAHSPLVELQQHVAAAHTVILDGGVECPPQLLPWYTRKRWKVSDMTLAAVTAQLRTPPR